MRKLVYGDFVKDITKEQVKELSDMFNQDWNDELLNDGVKTGVYYCLEYKEMSIPYFNFSGDLISNEIQFDEFLTMLKLTVQ
jgi:hypothetical protein